MIWNTLRCLILPHTPDRRRIHKLGEGLYYGHCAHCGAPIRRLKRDRWVRAGRANAQEAD